MQAFSGVLNVEAPKGVHVQCQIPLFVATKLAKMRKSLFVPTPDDFAKYSIRSVQFSQIYDALSLSLILILMKAVSISHSSRCFSLTISTVPLVTML